MQEDYFLTISKQELSLLPPAKFDGRIEVVDSEDRAVETIAEIRKAPLVGFDTETRPSFKKGMLNEVALMQLSTEDTCYLFRLNKIGLCKSLLDFIEDEKCVKVGLSLHDDFHNLHRIADFEPKGFIDLQHYVKQFKILDNSLSRINAIVFGKRISKGQRLSNWEASELSEAQKGYASLDAVACMSIYRELQSGRFDPLSSPFLHYADRDNPV